MTAVGLPIRSRIDERAARRWLALVLAIAGVLAWILFRGQMTLPHDDDAPVFRTLGGIRDWAADNRSTLAPVREGIGGLIDVFDELLASLGWPGVIAVVAAIGLGFGGVGIGLLAATGLASLGVLGLWDASMATLAMILSAVVISIAIGLPLGIIAGRSNRVAAVLSPILDVMQIMPTLAYLTPVTALFFIGATPSTVATLIYAIPPAIRITSLGMRGVPTTTVEAASAYGATGRQVLAKVQLPLAWRAIALGINQTIMLALSMVVIAGLIGAPGLGRLVINALSKVDVGSSFQAGIAIVILAVVLDRVTYAVGDRLDPRARIGVPVAQRGRLRRWLPAAVVLGLGLAAPAVIDATAFPDAIQVSFVGPVNQIAAWIADTFGPFTHGLEFVTTTYVLNPLETVLTAAPWWLVFVVAVGMAWILSGVRPAVVAGVCLGLIIILGLWAHSMVTLANVVVATALTLLIGLAAGIATARNARLRTVVRPILDAAQTLPPFVYLLPALTLFGPNRFTAIVAAIIFSIPPVIRLVEVGIRAVPPTAVEAATASGATRRQLLWKVQLPLSLQALLLAANQGIVMVLSMVVVGALVGAGALGYDVLVGFARGEQFGKGLAAGVAIVLLGIMLDRITQGAGGRRRGTVVRAG
ncbi:MAG TPA: ABC transporter permease subunit [Candidatus Limnocylindrales bacterium]|jgi:glycine betaine/proline transport system permease protein